jgi:AcrR family transcriptional regulator
MTAPEWVTEVRAPRPLLSQRAEQQLGARHREVLGQLEALFLNEGFAGLSVRELAAHVGCSRRTLYELAPSKDDLVLLVLDRFLQRVGRSALDSIDAHALFAEQIRAYIAGAAELSRLTQVFAEDLADEPAARRLFDRHFEFVTAVTEGLVRRGAAVGEFRPVAPAVVAGVLAGSALYFSQAALLGEAGIDYDTAIDTMVELVVTSLSRR